MEKKLSIFGVRPVTELIDSGKEIDTIYLQKDIKTDWALEIKKKCKEKNFNLKLVPRYKLNRLTRKNHQGVVGLASSIVFQNFENLLASVFSKGVFPFFILLDRLTDVRNFGSICRSAEAMGVHGVIIPKKESAQINEIAIKASAGSISNINICRENSLDKTIQIAKDSGLTIIACSEKSKQNIFETDLNKPTLIIIGSEKNGISQKLLNLSDYICKIPIKGKTESLNASVAAGIALYEANRQMTTN
ncbi:MAG: 23S rRNA (guanosine(2251)-2'-O)-methyltransferase RlmB [Flavobacteriales bacterium]|nr:23S rRNA (guanosine(2251)-2'-O)-methyltransferase RlmB [Flavobacteriales bacterium]|tara:strand:- start:3854 stop:4594 length:741 start_codon:yes stop_codon:yes gene_type:complete